MSWSRMCLIAFEDLKASNLEICSACNRHVLSHMHREATVLLRQRMLELEAEIQAERKRMEAEAEVERRRMEAEAEAERKRIEAEAEAERRRIETEAARKMAEIDMEKRKLIESIQSRHGGEIKSGVLSRMNNLFLYDFASHQHLHFR